ncbi:MAG: radical SAM/SPASM domain-containing protein [Bacteroidales bacterium]
MNRYALSYFFRLISKITPIRLFNLLKLRTSYYLTLITGKYIRWGYPWTASIEPSALCNLQCPECPIGSHMLTRPSNFISLEDYTRWIDQMHPHLFYLILYFQGEPLLHPQFPALVKIAHSRRIHTLTSTNAQVITPSLAQQLVEAGLDEIILSMDGTSEETYRQYRRGGTLKKALEGINNLVAARKQLGKTNPYLRLQFIVMRHNEHEMDEIKELGKRLGIDRVDLKSAQIYDPSDPHGILPLNQRYARYRKNKDGLIELKNPRQRGCHKMWEGTVITWDGQVLPCCYDKDAEHSFGRAHGSVSVKDVLNRASAKEFHQKVMQSRKHYQMCTHCHER